MKRVIRVLARLIGLLFVLVGFIFFGTAFLTRDWLLFGFFSILLMTLGVLLFKVDAGYLSDSAEKNWVDKLRESVVENRWKGP